MKSKILVMALLLGSFVVNADTISDQVAGAFTADEQVQEAARALRIRLQQAQPGCTLSSDPNLRGHVFSASANTTVNPDARTRVYLVSRGIACTSAYQTGVVAIRRSVTAKVLVSLRREPDGTYTDIPKKVILVDITNNESEE